MRRAVLALAILALQAPAASAATIDWTAYGTPGANGWYRSDVWINWTIANIAPPLQQGCNPVHLVDDTKGRQVTCTVTDASGTTSRTTAAIRVDQTPPTGAGAFGRQPDANGWFNHPVAVTFSGSDATSGIASCTDSTYAGPDTAAGQATGTCTDNAGNVATTSAPIRYDATAPSVTGVRAGRAPDAGGWYLAPVAIAWSGIDGVSGIAACSALTYAGPVGAARDPAGTCSDEAGNTSAPRAFGLRYGPPILSWRARRGAQYYNVQLFRNGRKVLSAWPRRARLALRRRWRYAHRTHRLSTGHYRWYVWPGYGDRQQRRYGRLVARRTFTVR